MARRRNARRIIVRAIVFLLLGAIVNVAVAWGCTWFQPRIAPDRAYHNPTRNPLVVLFEKRFGVAAVEQVERSGTFLDRWPDDVHVIDSDIWWSKSTLIHTGARSYATAAGWPELSLMAWGNTLESDERRHVVHFGFASDAEVTRNIMDGPCPRAFPLCPIWPGFAINTLFYAAILWLLFAETFAQRRRLRLKRGLCPACAYPIGASDVCTECGKPVKALLAA